MESCNESCSKTECVNRERNRKDCPCPHDDCSRRGVCCECLRHHRDYGGSPVCLK